MPGSEGNLQVAFASDARYLPWCAAAIRSCLDHGGEGLTIHLLHDVTVNGDDGVERLAAMVDTAGAALIVHGVDSDALETLPVVDRFGKAVWLRLLLPDLLPNLDRVLYLDVDTLVVAPLQPLFATDMGDAPLAAVTNVYSPEQRARVHALGIEDHRRYFNSGVLLLDLERLRSEGATATLKETVSRRAADLEMPDQDTLNLVFHSRWHALHPRWNTQTKFWEDPTSAEEVLGAPASEARRHPAILHFEGPSVCKPWHALNAHPWRREWWATLERTPFAGTPAEDHGAAMTVLRYLPRFLRIRAYVRLMRWRERRSASPSALRVR